MGTFFKINRAALTIALFALNSTMNDFFVCYFFMVTSLLGYVYLSMCGFERPKDSGKHAYAKGEIRSLKQHEQALLVREFHSRTIAANSVVIFLSLIFVVLGYVAYE